MEANGKQKLGGSFVMSRSKDTDSGVSEFIYTAGGFVWCDRPFYLVEHPEIYEF